NHLLNYSYYNISLAGTQIYFNAFDLVQPTYLITNLINVNALADGNYSLFVYARDSSSPQNANNKTTWFYVDKTAPNLTTINASGWNNPTPENGTYTNNQTHTFNITCNETFVAIVWLNLTGAVNITNTTPYSSGNNYWWTLTLGDGTYNFIAYCNDSAGNQQSNQQRTIIIDLTGPSVVSANVTNASNTSAVISWISSEASNGTIFYGKSSLNGVLNSSISTSSNLSLNTSHALFLTGLDQNTLYYYNISSCDIFGNCKMSGIYNFTTNATYDLVPPVIINVTAQPYSKMLLKNESINLTVYASDNIAVNSYAITITAPNGSIYSYTNSTITNFVGYLTGIYNVTILVRDDYGNNITKNDTFVVGLNRTTVQYNLAGQNQSLAGKVTISIHNSTLSLYDYVINGSRTDEQVSDFLVDYEYVPNNGLATVTLRGINLSIDSNETLRYEEIAPPISGYLATIGIESTYNSTISIRILFNYTNISYSNENNLKIYKCNDWNFTLGTCYGSWTDITAQITQDKTANYFIIDVNSLSGFSIQETAATSTPSSGGGGGSGIGGTSNFDFSKIFNDTATDRLVLSPLTQDIVIHQGEFAEQAMTIKNTRATSIIGCNMIATDSQISQFLDSEKDFKINPSELKTFKYRFLSESIPLGEYTFGIKIICKEDSTKEQLVKLKVMQKILDLSIKQYPRYITSDSQFKFNYSLVDMEGIPHTFKVEYWVQSKDGKRISSGKQDITLDAFKELTSIGALNGPKKIGIYDLFVEAQTSDYRLLAQKEIEVKERKDCLVITKKQINANIANITIENICDYALNDVVLYYNGKELDKLSVLDENLTLELTLEGKSELEIKYAEGKSEFSLAKIGYVEEPSSVYGIGLLFSLLILLVISFTVGTLLWSLFFGFRKKKKRLIRSRLISPVKKHPIRRPIVKKVGEASKSGETSWLESVWEERLNEIDKKDKNAKSAKLIDRDKSEKD
ncbi:MAG: fibronectin type III domain-containing protein, partial [Nanoarchaeota archaeon]|nr:fibronectin type III domain-containing protein [Nanoarchaeota archaeon]